MASHLIQRFTESLQLSAEVTSIILIEGKLRHIITQCTSERKGIWTGDSVLWVQENGSFSLFPTSKPSSNSSFKSIIHTQGIVNLLRKGKGAWNIFVQAGLSCNLGGKRKKYHISVRISFLCLHMHIDRGPEEPKPPERQLKSEMLLVHWSQWIDSSSSNHLLSVAL